MNPGKTKKKKSADTWYKNKDDAISKTPMYIAGSVGLGLAYFVLTFFLCVTVHLLTKWWKVL